MWFNTIIPYWVCISNSINYWIITCCSLNTMYHAVVFAIQLFSHVSRLTASIDHNRESVKNIQTGWSSQNIVLFFHRQWNIWIQLTNTILNQWIFFHRDLSKACNWYSKFLVALYNKPEKDDFIKDYNCIMAHKFALH